MSAFVVGDTEVDYGKFHNSTDTIVKRVSNRKKIRITIAISFVILLAVGTTLLVYFLTKGSSSKSMLPQFKGIVYIIPSIMLYFRGGQTAAREPLSAL